MRLFLLAVFAAALASAQAVCGAFVLGYATSSPKTSAGGFCAIPIVGNNQLVSFTEYQPQFVGRPIQFQVATRSGFATSCKTIGKLDIWCLATAGIVTSNGAAVSPGASLSASVGAVAFYPYKKWFIIGGFEVPWVSSPVPGQNSTDRKWGIGIARGFKR